MVLFSTTSSFAQVDKKAITTENSILIKGQVSDDEGFLLGANIILKTPQLVL